MAELQSIDGLEEILRNLEQLPKEMVSKRGGPVRSALRKAANVVRDEAKRLVPFGPEAPHVRDNIASSRDGNPQRSGASERYRVGVRGGARIPYANTAKNRRSGRVGKTYQQEGATYYWRFLEFGTEKMAARPFLRPAFESRKTEALNVFITDIQKSIDKITRKLEQQAK